VYRHNRALNPTVRRGFESLRLILLPFLPARSFYTHHYLSNDVQSALRKIVCAGGAAIILNVDIVNLKLKRII
jgi:hypothetical protein